jgi:hypothetical protein
MKTFFMFYSHLNECNSRYANTDSWRWRSPAFGNASDTPHQNKAMQSLSHKLGHQWFLYRYRCQAVAQQILVLVAGQVAALAIVRVPSQEARRVVHVII